MAFSCSRISSSLDIVCLCWVYAQSNAVRDWLGRPHPGCANPTLGALLEHLNSGKAHSCEQLAMLVDAQERILEPLDLVEPFERPVEFPASEPLVGFRDDDECAARLQDAEYLAHVAR